MGNSPLPQTTAKSVVVPRARAWRTISRLRVCRRSGESRMAANEEEAQVTQPDWALIMRDRMPDRGPRYTETPANLYAPDAPLIAEPWNAITASFFIWIVLWWAWRLRGRFRQYPFLVCCMPILLAGGIGGTLYHGTRSSVVWFLLDVVPISLLGFAGALYMAFRFLGRRQLWLLPALVVVYVVVHQILF